jgi:hypothetical protein
MGEISLSTGTPQLSLLALPAAATGLTWPDAIGLSLAFAGSLSLACFMLLVQVS